MVNSENSANFFNDMRFRVLQSEVDSFNHLNHAEYANYMQEAAIRVTSSFGFTPEWYLANGTGWFMRKLEIRYFAQARYGDEIEAVTWLSRFRRSIANREYLLTRVSDGAKVARGRAMWIYVNRETQKPIKFPPEMNEKLLATNEPLEDLGIRVPKPAPTENSFRYISRRRVQVREIDTWHHVNHVVYLKWIEQAYFDALRFAGHPVSETRKQGWFAFQGGHEIEYFAPAFDNDEIEIHSRIFEMGKVRGAWMHEIYNAETKQLLARDYSLGIFVDEKGKLISPPKKFIEDMLRGDKKLE